MAEPTPASAPVARSLQRACSLVLSLALFCRAALAEEPTRIRLKHLAEGDTVSVLPKNHLGFTEYPGQIYSVNSPDWPPAAKVKSDQQIARGLPSINPALKFLSIYDQVSTRYFSVSYFLGENGTFVKAHRTGPNFNGSSFETIEVAEWPSKDCSDSFLFVPYYEPATRTLQELIYCAEGGVLMVSENRQKPTLSRLRSDDSATLVLPKRFHRVVYDTSIKLFYLYYHLDPLKVDAQASFEPHQVQLLLLFLNSFNKLEEKAIDLRKSLIENQIKLLNLVDVTIFPQIHYGFYLPVHIQGFVQLVSQEIRFSTVDCLLNVQTYALSGCIEAFSSHKKPEVFHGDLVAAKTMEDGKSEISFEFLIDYQAEGLKTYKLLVISYKQEVDSNGKRQISDFTKSGLQDYPACIALGNKNINVQVLEKLVRKFSYVKDDKEVFGFYELLAPLSPRIYYYQKDSDHWHYSELGKFIQVNLAEGFYSYYTDLPFRLELDTKLLPKPSGEAGAGYLERIPYFNATSQQASSYEVALELFDRTLDYTNVRVENFPISNTTSTMSVYDVNWLSVNGPLFRVNMADDDNPVKMSSIDSSRLQYNYEVEEGLNKFEPMDLKWKTATASMIFDMEKRKTYNCKIFANMNLGRIKKVLCNEDEDFSAKIKSLPCEKLLDYNLNDQRFAAFCINTVTNKSESYQAYWYHLVDFDSGRSESGDFEVLAKKFETAQIILDDDYAYLFIKDSGVLHGFYSDWTFLKQREFEIGRGDLLEFSPFLMKTVYPRSDLRLGLVLNGRYSYSRVLLGIIVMNVTIPIEPDLADPFHSYCPLNFNHVYSRNGKVMVFTAQGEEYTLYPRDLHNVLHGIVCKDQQTAVIFWKNRDDNNYIYTVLKDQPNIEALRNRRQMTFVATDLPADLENAHFFVDEGRLYFADTEQGPVMLNTELPNTMFNWNALAAERLTLELEDVFQPANTIKMEISLGIVNESRVMAFNKQYEAAQNSYGEWSLVYKPLDVDGSVESTGHFWKVEASGPLRDSPKVEIANRFEGFLIDKDPHLKAKFKAYYSTPDYDLYINDTHVVITKPFNASEPAVLETKVLMDVVDIIEAGVDAEGLDIVLVRVNTIGLHSLRTVAFNRSDFSKGVKISDQLCGTFDSAAEEVKAVWAQGSLFYGLVKPLDVDLLEISSPKCGEKPLISEPQTEFYDIFMGGGELSGKVLVVFGQSKVDELRMKTIDGETCEVAAVEFEKKDDLARFYRKLDCEADEQAAATFHCVFAGFRIFWYELTFAEGKWRLERAEEYATYKNIEVEEVRISPGADLSFFLIRGERINQHKLHDGSGVLYFERNKSRALNHASGGVPGVQLISYGLGLDFTVDISSNNSIILDGGDTVAFFSVEDPTMTAHSLVEKEKKNSIEVYLFGWGLNQTKLTQRPPGPPAKKKSSKSLPVVLCIIGGLVVGSVLVVCLLINCVKKHISQNAEPADDSGEANYSMVTKDKGLSDHSFTSTASHAHKML